MKPEIIKINTKLDFGSGNEDSGEVNDGIKAVKSNIDVKDEEQQEEIESMEAEAEEEKQAEAQEDDYRYDYLSDTDSKFHLPSIGSLPAFGQEGVLYRPKDTGMLW